MSTLGLIIDIVLVAIVLIFAIIGLKKGFFKTILSLFSWVVCLLVAIFLAKYVANWINGIYDFTSLIGTKIEEALSGMGEVFNKSINSYNADGATAESVKTAILADIQAVQGMNGVLLRFIIMVFNNTSFDPTSTATVGNILGMTIGHMCVILISGILIFIVLKIVIALLTRLFDKISKVKIIGGLNKAFGFILGALKGACIVVIINIILVALSLIPPVNSAITPVIQDNTTVEKFVYNKTDEIIGKYVIEGNMIQEWVSDLWNAR